MANLLPHTQKKRIKREYLFRMLAVSLLLFSVVLASLLVFIATGLLSLYSTERDVDTYQNFLAQASGDSSATTTSNIQYINESVSALRQSTAYPSIREDIIEATIGERDAVLLTGFRYIRSGAENATLSIQGVAPTRTSLASFVERLEGKPYFTEVNTPLTSFVEQRDIAFSLSIDLDLASTLK